MVCLAIAALGKSPLQLVVCYRIKMKSLGGRMGDQSTNESNTSPSPPIDYNWRSFRLITNLVPSSEVAAEWLKLAEVANEFRRPDF